MSDAYRIHSIPLYVFQTVCIVTAKHIHTCMPCTVVAMTACFLQCTHDYRQVQQPGLYMNFSADVSMYACICTSKSRMCVLVVLLILTYAAQTETLSVEWLCVRQYRKREAPVKGSLAIALQRRRAGAVFARPGRVFAASAQFAGRTRTRGAPAHVVRSCRQDRCTQTQLHVGQVADDTQ